MQQTSISVSKTAKICTLGKLTEQTKLTWMCLHGYGFLAQYFIKHFETINTGSNFIIAPEALNRFYLEGTRGRVGASWMTKEQRETDIEDILNYLDVVYENLSEKAKANFVAFGFSQGTPAVFRWLVMRKIKVKAAVAWASDIPVDVLTPEGVAFLNTTKVFVVLGDQDEFVSPERAQQAKDQLEAARLDYELISFEGKHRILEEPLNQLYQSINDQAG